MDMTFTALNMTIVKKESKPYEKSTTIARGRFIQVVGGLISIVSLVGEGAILQMAPVEQQGLFSAGLMALFVLGQFLNIDKAGKMIDERKTRGDLYGKANGVAHKANKALTWIGGEADEINGIIKSLNL